MELRLDNKERIILKIMVQDKIAAYEESDYEQRDLNSIPLYQVLLDLRERLTKVGAE